jgi:hypothetical protein
MRSGKTVRPDIRFVDRGTSTSMRNGHVGLEY